MKKTIYTLCISLGIAVSIIAVQAAVITPKYPGQLNWFNEGDVIEEEDWNAIEQFLGSRWCPSDLDTATTVYCIAKSRVSTSTWATLWAAKTTTNLPEGTNLYYTPARIAGVIAATTTDAIAEGSSNLYWTQARLAAGIAATTTDALAEGSSNLYWSNGRVSAFLSNTATSAKFSDTVTTVKAAITGLTGLVNCSGTAPCSATTTVAVNYGGWSASLPETITNKTFAYVDNTPMGFATSNAAVTYAHLTDVPATFAPSAHATNHYTGGSDPLASWMFGSATDTAAIRALTGVNTGDQTFNSNWTVVSPLVLSPSSTGYTVSSAAFTANVGAAATVAYSFSGDPNTGMYSTAADTINLGVGGTSKLQLSSLYAIFAASLMSPNGTATLPGLASSGDTNTGMYFPQADHIGFSLGGVSVLTLAADGVTTTMPIISTSNANFQTVTGTALAVTGLVGIPKCSATAPCSVAANGTDYTLITAVDCDAGQHVDSITAAGVAACTADTGGTPFSTEILASYDAKFGGLTVTSISGIVKCNGASVCAAASSGTDFDTAAAWNTNALASTTPYFASMKLGTDLPVSEGGTGASTLTGVCIGNGTSAFTATTVLAVNKGGTGASSFTASTLLKANGDQSFVSIANGYGFLRNNGTGTFSFTSPTGVQFSVTGSADHVWSGDTTLCTAGETLAFGDFVYRNTYDGRCWKADTNTASTMPIFGVDVNGGAAGTQVVIASDHRGVAIRDDTWNWTTATTQRMLYAGETAGTVAQTPPVAAGSMFQWPCQLVDADNLLCDFDNSLSW